MYERCNLRYLNQNLDSQMLWHAVCEGQSNCLWVLIISTSDKLNKSSRWFAHDIKHKLIHFFCFTTLWLLMFKTVSTLKFKLGMEPLEPLKLIPRQSWQKCKYKCTLPGLWRREIWTFWHKARGWNDRSAITFTERSLRTGCGEECGPRFNDVTNQWKHWGPGF